jgi:hypothetical protein
MGCQNLSGQAAPVQTDSAVALCCDAKYFPFALFMIRQIAFHNPQRSFDFVIATADPLELPGWANDLGIRLHHPEGVSAVGNINRFGGTLIPLFRLFLARSLGHIYRRILYLDCDMFVEGGDIDRLLSVDIGQHPFAAVRDYQQLISQGTHSREFAAAGLAQVPYFNSGLLLIDTAAFEKQEVRQRSLATAETYPQAMVFADQSLLNLALHGGFAELSPAWNWQWNFDFPLVPLRYPVFIRHFIGPKKPFRESRGGLDVRFSQSYAAFFRQYFPERLAELAPACDPAPMTFGQVARIAYRHMQSRGIIADWLQWFPDPYVAHF